MSEMHAHNPLVNHTVLATVDPVEACHAIQKVICPHRLSVVDGNSSLDVKFCLYEMDSIKLGYLRYGRPVLINIDNLTDNYILKIPVHGKSSTQLGKSNTVATDTMSGAVLSPDHLCNMKFDDDYEEIITCIDKTSLLAQFNKITGFPARNHINFQLNFDLNRGIGKAIRELILYLIAEVDKPDSVISSRIVKQQYAEILINMILTGLVHDNTDILGKKEGLTHPRVVQQIIEYMNEHYSEVLTVSGLSDLAGINVRSLQTAFKRSFALSPTEYLKGLRLQKLRDKLLKSSIDDSVTTLMMETGFTHFGRCASEYRKRFGETPSETLITYRRPVKTTLL